MKGQIIGIDIGGTNFRIGLVSERGELSSFEKKSSATLTGASAVKRLIAEISAYIGEQLGGDAPKAIAIGFPSSVSHDKTVIYSTPNLAGFDNINLKAPLEAAFSVPVFLDRDVNFLLAHDIENLGLDPSGSILGFYVGTGFGNAIYLDGRFHGGKNGTAGELGHVPLFRGSEPCSCGLVGCVETHCSGRHLQRLSSELFPFDPIGEIFLRHSEHPRIIEFVEDLAYPIAAEITLLDPDVSVLAGGVITMDGFPRERLERTISARVRHPYPAENLRLIFTEHTQQSGVLGGARFAWQHLKEANI